MNTAPRVRCTLCGGARGVRLIGEWLPTRPDAEAMGMDRRRPVPFALCQTCCPLVYGLVRMNLMNKARAVPQPQPTPMEADR